VAESDNLTSARDELGLLLDELRSFAANRGAGIHRKCIANLYYAAFHAVRAMLFYHGLDTRTHEGTQRLFAAHFVKPGLMPKAHLRCLATLESDRLRADYQGFHSFEAADVERGLDCVRLLVTDVLAYLRAQDPNLPALLDGPLRDAMGGLTADNKTG
jgi:uncharacterized protein (UPF0332 family)